MGSDFGSKKMAKAIIAYLFLCAFSQGRSSAMIVPSAKGCLQLLTHSQWGGKPANCSAPMKKRLPEYVIIISTVGNECRTKDECSKEMQSIQNLDQGIRGWCDLSYNFLIGEDGFVYEGRGWQKEGAHSLGYNDLALGIAFIGTFTERTPNEAAWNALQCLLDVSVKEGHLAPNYIVLAHSDVNSTDSPGDPVRSVISKWPNYKHN